MPILLVKIFQGLMILDGLLFSQARAFYVLEKE